ncbi:MAG: putative DNA binding domain-containing protein, partial [Bacteroidetes bacterium]|nr:putative DNA binding domain-containing protein [Bacteroidota bacterium]
MTSKEFEDLLTKPEGRIIDFKEAFYDFQSNADKADASLVKDLLAFSNTVRKESAYVIFGIRNNPNGQNIKVGVTNLIDESILQQKAASKISPAPQFSFEPLPYQGMVFGILEIPVYPHERALIATGKFKGVETDKVYIRRGTSNSEATIQEIDRIKDWLADLKLANRPLPERPKYEPVPNYLSRTVSPADGDSLRYYFQDHESLLQVLKKEDHITLLAWGLSGKSTELKQLAFELSTSSDLYVFLLNLGDHLEEPIESKIPEIAHIPKGQMVVLLDGLDEVLAEHFEGVRRLISQFVSDYPNCKVIVSSRTNFYTTDPDDDGISTLKYFTAYDLDPVSSEEIDKYLEKTLKTDRNEFIEQTRRKGIQDLLVIPYYLLKLVDNYKLNHTIAESKAELFEQDIRQLIRKEIARPTNSKIEIREKHLYSLLEKAAFIMEARGTNQLNTDDLNEIFPADKDFDVVTRASSIFQGTGDVKKKWKFNHNNTQEYLAAQLITKLKFSNIRDIMGNPPDLKKIKPSWVNTLSFLNSILEKDSKLKKKITNWLAKENRDLVILLEPEKISPEVRLKVFKSIFIHYKNEDRRINRTIYRTEDLAKFAESVDVFDFLLAELDSPTSSPNKANAIELVNHFALNKYPIYQGEFKKQYEKVLYGGDPTLHYLALAGYCTNLNVTSDEFLKA